ncbi:PD-(D/E)XK nuclease-like domain-containing protein [Sanguibacter sp. HDW7]|uniref:PD-(D/E)XK nuclease-like domain-containing protein n=1 Tax=Sanguibacter sp. HDW7 TaxID=2714931 RepID=UPI001407522C|nr:PD-(D/E)XK nuclease-like domain-containing protein [Sanguibacter sp. HDW7]QIK82427.1 hypothetical protein G7063_01455 [Sanguibacter sp. HDW7]
MTLTPQIVYDMDETTYHARPELSSTGVRRLLDSPARFQWDMTHRVESVAYDVGHATHSRILGVGSPIIDIPDEHLTPSGNVSTKAATVAWLAEQRDAGLVPIGAADRALIDGMAEAVLAHPAARALLERPGQPEVSAFATDPETGVALRARFDRLCDDVAIDVKTTAGSAGPIGFAREAARYGYPIQEAHYADVLERITGERHPMAFVVVEKRRPHLVAVHYFDEITRMTARDLTARARQTYAECIATDAWPGYSGEPYTTQVPGWWLDQADEQEELVI